MRRKNQIFALFKQILNISSVWQYLANAKRAAAKEVEGGWMEPKQHLSHFIHQNTLYSIQIPERRLDGAKALLDFELLLLAR